MIVWVVAGVDNDPADKLLWAASWIRATGRSESEAPRRRGTICVWCPACRRWSHISGLHLDEQIPYDKVIVDDMVAKLGRQHRLLAELDAMWDRQELPR